MFKRVERKRKRREEDDELGLDQDMRETMGLNDTDSDESDSGSEHESAQSDNPDEDLHEDSPISVAEVLKDPIYLISLDPTIHGCVLCKGRLIKSAGMAAVHKDAQAHKRRFEHFKLLSADVDPRSNAWQLVRTIRFASDQRTGSQKSSKRAVKRQAKQAAIREKRKRHKDLKAKAAAKKALKNSSKADETRPVVASKMNLRSSPVSQNQPGKSRKKPKLESKSSTGTIMKAQDVTEKSASHTKIPSDGTKSAIKNRLKSRRKVNKPS